MHSDIISVNPGHNFLFGAVSLALPLLGGCLLHWAEAIDTMSLRSHRFNLRRGYLHPVGL
jgi:hypothetical protein